MAELTPKEISALRGKLKARKRASSMKTRYSKKLSEVERLYQEKLAKDIIDHI
jgi:hypothetical protein